MRPPPSLPNDTRYGTTARSERSPTAPRATQANRSQAARAHIPVDVAAAELGQRRCTRHVPADDRAHRAPVPERQRWSDHARRPAGNPPPAALEVRPAEIGRGAGSQRQDVHLLEDRLAHVRHDQTPPRRVEGEPPGHPQARGQQLRAGNPLARIEAHDLPVEPSGVLARLGAGAEAEACVEEPVGAEGSVASHVHAASARQRQQRARMAGAPVVTGTKLVQVHSPVLARVEQVDAPARPVSRRQGERERATLVSELVLWRQQADEPASVQHEASAALAPHAPDAAAALEHVESARLARGAGHVHRLAKFAHRGELQRTRSGGRRRDRSERRNQRQRTPYFSNSNSQPEPDPRLNRSSRGTYALAGRCMRHLKGVQSAGGRY